MEKEARKNMKKKQIRKVRKWMRLHVILTAIVFGVYFLAAFFYSPYFFLSDIQAKIHALADTVAVTARVLDAPMQPIATATATCDTSVGVLSVDLDWPTDENSYTYDIFRDGDPLVTGLTDSSYEDTNVSIGMSYDYYVIANGPMGPGSATSDVVSVATPSECEIALPDPTGEIITLDILNITEQSGASRITDQTPLISGTTNIPFAVVDIVIHSDMIVVLQTIANGNGYWEVQVLVELSLGSHTIYLTVTDPDDSSRTATHSIDFIVEQIAQVIDDDDDDDDNGSGSSRKKKSRSTSTTTVVQEPDKSPAKPSSSDDKVMPVTIPVDFLFHISDENRTVIQGQSVNTEILITRLDEKYIEYSSLIRYSVTDEDGVVAITVDRNMDGLKLNQKVQESISIPAGLKKGQYVLRAELIIGEFDIIRSVEFSIVELPLFDLGSGFVITYPQFVRNIGWVAFISLFSMSSWSLLWIREYWLYTHARRYIAERNLAGKGFIAKRKEVSR